MNKYTILLLCVVLLGGVLRVIQLTSVPPGLNRDEAAIGYTAYSLLRTGKDEYGKFLPISLKSFGDWKLPGYVYTTIPFVGLLGLSEFSVRLPSVVFGSLAILLTYFIADRLFKNKQIALVAAAIIAISPWHLFFSRVTSEANLAVFLTSCGVWLMLRAKTKPLYYILASLALAASMYTYHGNHVFTPLLFLVLLWYQRKEIFSTNIGKVSVGLFSLIVLFIFSQTLFSADKTKISGLFSLNDPAIVYGEIVENRLIFKNEFLGKLFNNKAVFLVENVIQNYIKSFSPEFLFIHGGTNAQHNIPDFGNLYLIELPFLILGLYFLFAKKEKYAGLLVLWLLISPVGAALTKDAPHSARQFAIFPALSIVIGYGVIATLQQIKLRRIRNICSSILAILFVANLSLFLVRYFVLFPYKTYAAWGDGYEQMVDKISSYQGHYKEIVVSRPDYSPYIYYLFYRKSDPQKVQNELQHYTETSEGFSHVKFFDGITYQKINWAEELLVPNRLYVDWAEGVPTGATNSAILISKDELVKLKSHNFDTSDVQVGVVVTSHLLDTIKQPNGAPLFYLIETRVGTPSATLQ